MNNKEKAAEIAEDNFRFYKSNKEGEISTDSCKECEQSALEMAEWKDSQTAKLDAEYIEIQKRQIELANQLLENANGNEEVIKVANYFIESCTKCIERINSKYTKHE